MTAQRLEYVEVGDPTADPIVFLGSLGSTHAMWEPQLTRFGRTHRAIALDLRGHGGSPVPAGPLRLDDHVADLLAVLDRSGVDRAHLVGLSLGGMIAMLTAIRCPERVATLTVLCTSACLPPRSGWLERAATVESLGMSAVVEPVLDRWLTRSRRAAPAPQDERLRQMMSAVDPGGYAANCRCIADVDLRADLQCIAAPVLAIAGEEDVATPPEHLESIGRGVVRGKVVTIGGAAHLANWEQPEAVNEAIERHLRSADVSGERDSHA